MSAKAKARPCSKPNSTITKWTGITTAIAAPSAAPEAVPRTYGSASGFRMRPWKVAPATASAAPTSIAVRTRGIRRSHTMASVAGVHVRPRSMPNARHRITPMLSAGPIRTDPRPTPTMRATPRASTAATVTDARAPTEVAGDADRSDLVGQDPG